MSMPKHTDDLLPTFVQLYFFFPVPPRLIFYLGLTDDLVRLQLIVWE